MELTMRKGGAAEQSSGNSNHYSNYWWLLTSLAGKPRSVLKVLSEWGAIDMEVVKRSVKKKKPTAAPNKSKSFACCLQQLYTVILRWEHMDGSMLMLCPTDFKTGRRYVKRLSKIEVA